VDRKKFAEAPIIAAGFPLGVDSVEKLGKQILTATFERSGAFWRNDTSIRSSRLKRYCATPWLKYSFESFSTESVKSENSSRPLQSTKY
jgi:hypothetical protein